MIKALDPVRVEEARIREAYARREVSDARYSWFSPGYQFMVQQRERRRLALMGRYNYENLAAKKILEVGCGTGQWLRDFVKWGARPESVMGVDLLPDRVTTARQLCPPSVHIQCASAIQL